MKNVNSTQIVNFICLMLAYQFETIPLLEKYIFTIEENHGSSAGHFVKRYGMARFLLYKSTGKRKHRSSARKMTSIFRSWSKKGFANNEPFAELLNMELVASTTALSKRKVRYATCQRAIDAFARAGLGVSWAIAYERATWMMLELDDRDKAVEYA